MRCPVVKFHLLTLLLGRTKKHFVNLGPAKDTVKVPTETTCRPLALEAAAVKEKKTWIAVVRVGPFIALQVHPFMPT